MLLTALLDTMQRGALVRVSKRRTGGGLGVLRKSITGGFGVSKRKEAGSMVVGLQPGPACALFEVFVSTQCSGGAFVASSLLAQNTWNKLVKEGGAYFAFQLKGTAPCSRKVGGQC